MGCLKRYTKIVDGTIPVPALLYDDEDLLASQESVGIYDGSQKSAHHQSGTIHTTTHRLFYIDNPHPRSRSFALDLSHVARTEYYAGLFTSSPKVTLYLHALPLSSQSASGSASSNVAANISAEVNESAFDTWECEVCSYKNPPGLSPAASKVCALCGVPRAAVPSTAPIPTTRSKPHILSSSHISSSFPFSSPNFLSPSSSSSPAPSRPDKTAATGENGEIPCPACTFLNHPSLAACEICGTALPHSSKSSRTTKSAPVSRPTTPGPDADDEDDDEEIADSVRMIRLSFRKGGDKPFYAVMRRSLLAKGWEVKRVGKSSSSSASPTSKPGTIGRSGIDGLLRSVATNAATAQSDMDNALQDLEALMVKAKDMVRLASDLNERLTAATTSTLTSTTSPSGNKVVEPEEATFIRSSLSQLGLQMTNAPVTLDMIRDERRWYEELARELTGVLQGNEYNRTAEWDSKDESGGGMMKRRGIVGLDEIWGGWNRARGVALIPPSTFLLVLPHLPTYTSPPIHMRTFPSSGFSVLHTPPYTKAAFASRVVGLLTLAGPRTTVEVAQDEQLPIALTEEMIREVEDAGEVCRDEGGGGVTVFHTSRTGQRSITEVKWWVNIFRGYVWDGQIE